MTGPNGRYTVETRPAGDFAADDRRSVRHLLGSLIGETAVTRWEEGFWRWKHVENPFGGSWVATARDRSTGEIVSVQHAIAWTLEDVDGTSVRAARHCDGATDPAHQRRGLYTATDRSLHERLEAERVTVLLGTPNEKTLGMELKTGWRIAARPRRFVRPVLSGATVTSLLGRTGTAGTGEHRQAPDEGLLWPELLSRYGDDIRDVLAANEALRHRVGLRTTRTFELLRWRYGACPTATYRVVPWESDRLEGFAVLRTAARGSRLPAAVLTEAFVRDPNSSRYAKLLREVVRNVRAGYLTAHFTADTAERGGLLRSGFLPAPRRRGVLTARGLGLDAVHDDALGAWDLTLGELEVF